MIDRRDFLRFLAAGVASSLIPFDPLKAYPLMQNENPSMAVVRGENAGLAVRKAVELIGGMKSFISKGDSVFVKPNMSWDRIPTQAANTNPDVVAEVVKMALEAGAKKVVVADNSCNASSYPKWGSLISMISRGPENPARSRASVSEFCAAGDVRMRSRSGRSSTRAV